MKIKKMELIIAQRRAMKDLKVIIDSNAREVSAIYVNQTNTEAVVRNKKVSRKDQIMQRALKNLYKAMQRGLQSLMLNKVITVLPAFLVNRVDFDLMVYLNDHRLLFVQIYNIKAVYNLDTQEYPDEWDFTRLHFEHSNIKQ